MSSKFEDVSTIKELANLQIENIFEALGISAREKYHSLVAPCPVHGGKRRDAFSWHVERGIWKCFSRSCDEKWGSDIFGLVEGIRGGTFKQAVEWTKKFVNLNLTDEELQEIKDSRSNKDYIVSVKRKESNSKIYPVECLKKLIWHDYLVNQRGFPKELVELYHIGACLTPHTYMSNRVVIPVINKSNEIVGFTGRTLDLQWKERGIPKWKHSLGSWIDTNLFNAHRAAQHIQKLGWAIICEGPLDVLRLEEAGVKNAVAIMGKKLHSGQMTLLMTIGATKLLLALDNDIAGKIGISGAAKSARYLFDLEVLELPDGTNDLAEMSAEKLKELIDEKCCNLSR